MRSASRFYTPSTGNAAFDEWRTVELARLDEERRKLDDAQREFAEYVDAIRRAKDREEFERFMAERRARPTNAGSCRGSFLSVVPFCSRACTFLLWPDWVGGPRDYGRRYGWRSVGRAVTPWRAGTCSI